MPKRLAEIFPKNTITHTMDGKYEASNAADIYKILTTGGEWDSYLRTFTGLTKPKVLAKSKSSGSLLQASADRPRLGTNDLGGVAFSYRLLEVAEMMVHLPLDPDDWRDEFPDWQPSGNMLNLEYASQISDTIIETLLQQVKTYNSDLYVQGDDSLSSPSQLRFFDGFLKIMAADADVVDVANVGVLTTSNILSVLNSVKDARPTRLRTRPNQAIFMSYTDWDKAQEANKASNAQDISFLEQGDIGRIDNVPLIPMNSVPENSMFWTIAGTGEDSNLVRGVWFQEDEQNFIIAKEAEGDKTWKFLMRYLDGVQYRTGEDVVLYQGS
jgi:hypothetical protein